MFFIALFTLLIGYNQYLLSKEQKYFEVKKLYISKYLDSVRDINSDLSDISRISRDLIRKCLDEKILLENDQNTNLTLRETTKTSLKDFYKKWDDIKSKVITHQHELPIYLLEKYQKFTYCVAFDRSGSFKDPWNNNYELTVTLLDPNNEKTITTRTDDMDLLPYGKCFSYAQDLNDDNDYYQNFESKSELLSFLDCCIELGKYSFDIQDELAVDANNYLVKISLEN